MKKFLYSLVFVLSAIICGEKKPPKEAKAAAVKPEDAKPEGGNPQEGKPDEKNQQNKEGEEPVLASKTFVYELSSLFGQKLFFFDQAAGNIVQRPTGKEKNLVILVALEPQMSNLFTAFVTQPGLFAVFKEVKSNGGKPNEGKPPGKPDEKPEEQKAPNKPNEVKPPVKPDEKLNPPGEVASK